MRCMRSCGNLSTGSTRNHKQLDSKMVLLGKGANKTLNLTLLQQGSKAAARAYTRDKYNDTPTRACAEAYKSGRYLDTTVLTPATSSLAVGLEAGRADACSSPGASGAARP
mmetsp:Transcript_37943/g.60098  ORF Transcript_37943/g.60098 Transcript_37943/m.60098 type:complete len:111 (+) Transcript_37943:77-409(+)